MQYFDYSQRHIITNSPIIAHMFTFSQVEFEDNSTGIVINTTILHDENIQLIQSFHILGEFDF